MPMATAAALTTRVAATAATLKAAVFETTGLKPAPLEPAAISRRIASAVAIAPDW